MRKPAGRPPKALIDDVVRLSAPTFGVVARIRKNKRPAYGVVATDALGRFPRGPIIWRAAEDFERTGRISRLPGRVARAKWKAWGLSYPESACGCLCCSHSWADLERPPDRELEGGDDAEQVEIGRVEIPTPTDRNGGQP